MNHHLRIPSAFPFHHGLRRIAMAITNLVITGVVAAAAVEFDRPFAPLPGLVKQEEKPFRDELCLNGRWQFQPVATPEGWTAGKDAPPALTEPKADAWDATPIKIPSPWNMNAFDSFGASDGADYRSFPSYPSAWEKVEMAWLRRGFKVPDGWKGRRLLLQFEAVSGDCEVRVNGKVLARNADKFLPFDVDVTDAVSFDGPNELLVGVRAMRFFNRPGRFGQFTHPTGAWWTGENGAAGIFGIWQDVYLHALPQTSVSDVFVQPLLDAGELRVDVELHNDAAAACDVRVEARVVPWLPSGETDVLLAPEKRGAFGADVALRFAQAATAELATGDRQTVQLVQPVGDELKKWTPAQPNLYGLLVEVKSGDRVIDRRMTRFGWRQFGFKGRQFALNGEVMRLNIELCHFFGVAHLSPRHAWAWFRMIKDCNINAVRLHAMPYPRFYLELADEMGILVHDETAIYGSHANFNLDEPVTWKRFGDHVERLVRRDRNHACVFGWSVENETLNALKIRTSDTKEHDAVRDRFAPLVETVRRLDPTRPWISSDGGKDWSAIYPVVLAHYGPGADYYRTYDSLGKPWGVTEATYLWGRMPSEVSRYNGERAYESWCGRVEGMAFEVWDELVEKQIKPFPEISVVSVYDVTYYGLWPQPLGLGDLTRPPTLDDGVRFSAPFVEGRPGIQPERLGPYSTMLNPGYDPGLPLYQPSPVFDAARAAYAPERPQDFPRRLFEKPDAPIQPGPPPPLVNDGKLMRVAFLGDASGVLFKSLEKAGVPLAPNPGDSAAAMVVDIGSLTEPSAARAKIDKTLANGGTVLVWGVNPETLAAANTLLPEAVRVAPRSASSLLPQGSDALAAALRPSRCYFSEAAEGRIIMQYGIEGPLVEKGRIVLRAADINWQLWRDRFEPIKVAAVIRSEREAKPPAAALVELPAGTGRLLVSSLEAAAPTPSHVEFFRAMFIGLGVRLLEPEAMTGGLLDGNGFLTKALVLGPFAAASYEAALDQDFMGGETTLHPKPGQTTGGNTWHEMAAGADAVFQLNDLKNDPEAATQAAYLSFWLFSPRSDDLMQGGVLLDHSQGAKVDFLAGSDDGAKIWFNGKPIHENRGKNPLTADQYRLAGLSLQKGWNHFLIKVINDRGNWQFKGRLQCSYPTLAPLLETAVSQP